MPTAPKLQMLNYVNVLAYFSYFAALFGSARAGLPDNAELSDKYQTLITPSAYAFAIWGIIFTAELVWTIFQLTPTYRSDPLVVKGVGYNFALACLSQAVWTIVFSLEYIALSQIAMFGILIPLLSILSKTTKQSSFSSSTTTLGDYWLLKFPFEIHASWVLCATLLNANVLSVAWEASATVQTTVGVLSLATLFGAGVAAVARKKQKVWMVPCVVAWASFAISKELSAPRNQIRERFPEATIEHTRVASSVVGYLLLLVVSVALFQDRFFPASAASDDDDEDVLDSDEDRGQEDNNGFSPLN